MAVNIVHLGYYHPYQDTRILQKECKALARNSNFNVTYITTDRHGSTDKKNFDGVNLKIVPLRGRRFIRLFHYLKDIKKIVMDMDCDIVHLHEPAFLPVVSFFKRKGKKVIYDQHEYVQEQIIRLFTPMIGKKLSEFIGDRVGNYEHRKVDKCNGFIYVTPAFYYESKNKNLRSALIPNFPIKRPVDEEEKNIAISENRICFAGSVNDLWSISDLVSIVNDMDRDIKLEIAGFSTPPYIEEIKEKNINSKMKYLGVLPFEDVPKLYDRSSMGIALLKRRLSKLINTEGTLANNKLFEFMRAGLPVVFSDFPIWLSIQEEYDFGIAVDPEDEDAILKAIEYLLDNPEVAIEKGRNGQRAVLEKYNWQESEKEFLSLYEDVISM